MCIRRNFIDSGIITLLTIEPALGMQLREYISLSSKSLNPKHECLEVPKIVSHTKSRDPLTEQRKTSKGRRGTVRSLVE